jgi:acyl-coenzyme A synthetase/AMP-(fatty) acid ligase/3-hydroxymyristoyl/3-hydroxydecanoyl-(acyl carrier protein) dehydratase
MLSLLCAVRSPSRTVGWRHGKPVAYGHFVRRVNAWRALLRETSGSSFALYSDDSVEFACALFGAWHARKMIYLAADRLPATCAKLRESVQGYLGEFPSEWQPLAPLSEHQNEQADDCAPLRPDFVGLMLYTSGTTGAAQAIPKTLLQMATEVATLENQFGATLQDAEILATVSHQHIYGLLFKVLWPLTAGRPVHARSFAFFEDVLEAVPQRRWALVSSPAHLKRLPESPAWHAAAQRLKAVFSSGGPLSPSVARDCERLLGRAPIEVYGSSETGGIAWRQQHQRGDEAWLPFPGVQWRIGRQEGVLTVRSPHLMQQDWFRTSDRAVAAGQNRFQLQGRVDRIAKVEGKRISLSAIEAQLKASRLVDDARVIAMEGPRERIAALIVPSQEGRRHLVEIGKLAFNRMLTHLLRDSIEPVGRPRVWRYLDAFPLNAQGKTTHAELLALVQAAPSRPTLPLARLVANEPHRAVFEFRAPRDLLYFDGHFATMPILAGVVQVDWVIRYGRQCFDLPPRFRAIHALKFHRLIVPEIPLELELVHDPAKFSLSFKITSDRGCYASGRVLFGAADV